MPTVEDKPVFISDSTKSKIKNEHYVKRNDICMIYADEIALKSLPCGDQAYQIHL